MGFNEKVHAYIAAKYYVYLTQEFDERGRLAFVHATQYYGMQRGRRMAQRAIRDGQPLTQASYNYYGEWVSTEELKATGCANQSELLPDDSLKITRCPWHIQFTEMGLTEAGAEYCSHVDSAISRGFNPQLNYIVDQTLHTHDCCIQRLAAGFVGEGVERGKNPAGLKDFTYHCAHSYWAYTEVTDSIFSLEGRKISTAVLNDIAETYGKEMADKLMEYKGTNFNVCD
jgi:hypothetical protein